MTATQPCSAASLPAFSPLRTGPHLPTPANICSQHPGAIPQVWLPTRKVLPKVLTGSPGNLSYVPQGGLSLHRPVGRWEAQVPAQSSQKHPGLAAGEAPGARILHTATLAPCSLLCALVPQNDCPQLPSGGDFEITGKWGHNLQQRWASLGSWIIIATKEPEILIHTSSDLRLMASAT